MKKIVGIMGAALMLASSVSAADFAARVYMTGDIAGGNIAVEKDDNGELVNSTSTYVLKLNETNQKDADALIVSANGDKAGASFQMWYTYNGADPMDLGVRSTSLWFKPVDMLKITVGDVSVATYREMLHYWKDPVGGSLSDWNSWGAKYSNYATVEGAGINFELVPVAGLTINAGIAPGTGNNFATITKTEHSVAAYGLSAQYSNIAGLPLSAGISWRDAGDKRVINKWGDGANDVAYTNTLSPKVLAIGADYGNNYAAGFYGMLNARLRFEQKTGDDTTTIQLAGITFDNYLKYSVGALTVAGRFPVTVRLLEDEVSYICWDAKVSYGLSGFTPYFLFGTDLDNDGAWSLSKDFVDTMNWELQPGVTLNVGTCAIDVAAKVKLNAPIGEKDIGWSVPFTLSVAY
ncbi:MAG: hypothetical protein K5866_09820 [Treponema sp.]|nr:hypothetical protein [Treponema sp.]